jgi:hypothetical protein
MWNWKRKSYGKKRNEGLVRVKNCKKCGIVVCKLYQKIMLEQHRGVSELFDINEYFFKLWRKYIKYILKLKTL